MCSEIPDSTKPPKRGIVAEFTTLLNDFPAPVDPDANQENEFNVKVSRPPIPSSQHKGALVALKRKSSGSFNLVRLRSQQADNLVLYAPMERSESKLTNKESTFQPLVKLRSQRIDLAQLAVSYTLAKLIGWSRRPNTKNRLEGFMP